MASLKYPTDLKYSKTDEWVRVEGDLAMIGITDYAQDQLGDIIYVELPCDIGQGLAYESKCGYIESVSATSELLSPISGEILKTNEALRDHPKLINDDPYNQGWMLTVKISDPSEIDQLIDANEYLQYIHDR